MDEALKSASERIADNIARHENIAYKYDQRHGEIYNSIEQERLQNALTLANSMRTSPGLLALDYGCGAGNLTRHLLGLGFEVIAADVTPSFTEITANLQRNRVRPFILNGMDMDGVPSDSVDFIATYSVLHHIPDYLSALREFVRVVSPGGIIYLDHEASDEHWMPSEMLTEFRTKTRTRESIASLAGKLISPSWWQRRIRKTLNPRYAEEGDIHVWPDDHIEWNRIRVLLNDMNVEILREESYLLYQPHYSVDVWEDYRHSCTDMHMLIARKRA